MKKINQIKTSFPSKSCNEALARGIVSSFLAQCDPNIEELNDIKTAVSEAVTNAIIHGYENEIGIIKLNLELYENQLIAITISDKGKGIPDIAKAKEPMFTTGGSERAGLGFAVMESFMDKVKVTSTVGRGTKVCLMKTILEK